MNITAIIHHPECGLLRLCTGGAEEGWTCGVSDDLAREILGAYEPLLLGEAVWERERLWRQCRDAGRDAGLPPASWGHVDVALWDLFARAQRLPLFRAIGGFRNRIPAYRRGTVDLTLAAVLREATVARDAGYLGYSLRMGAEEDVIAALLALRPTVGDDFRLMYDGAGELEPEQALAVGRALEDIDGHWFAEPLRNGDVTGLQKLADALDVPVVAGAFIEGSIVAGTQALTTRAVDRLRATIPTTGGITDALKLARGAESLGMNCEIDWDRSAGPHAAAHLLGAIRNAELYAAEGTSEAAMGFAPLHVSEGELLLPPEPGLGLCLNDPSFLDEYRT
jgi:L-alanine-DL-glutamate epimerase-like enolase superfamily enzyme